MTSQKRPPQYISNKHSQILVAEDLRGETMVTPAKKLEDLIHLAELCVDLLQQNEEHYAEVKILKRLVRYITFNYDDDTNFGAKDFNPKKEKKITYMEFEN